MRGGNATRAGGGGEEEEEEGILGNLMSPHIHPDAAQRVAAANRLAHLHFDDGAVHVVACTLEKERNPTLDRGRAWSERGLNDFHFQPRVHSQGVLEKLQQDLLHSCAPRQHQCDLLDALNWCGIWVLSTCRRAQVIDDTQSPLAVPVLDALADVLSHFFFVLLAADAEQQEVGKG